MLKSRQAAGVKGISLFKHVFHCSNHPFHTLLVDGIIQNPTTLLLKLFRLLLPDELWGVFSEGRKNGYLLGKISHYSTIL